MVYTEQFFFLKSNQYKKTINVLFSIFPHYYLAFSPPTLDRQWVSFLTETNSETVAFAEISIPFWTDIFYITPI